MGEIVRRDDQFLVFQSNGEGFVDTVDLHAIERLLPEYRRLLDVAFRYSTGVDVHRNRERLVRYSTRFETGCLDVIVDIAAKAAPIATGLIAADSGGYQVAKTSFLLISKVLELRKKVRDLLDANKKLPDFQMNMQNATLSESLVSPIFVNGSNNTITVAPTVYFAALASHGAVNRLAKCVDGQTIAEVNVQHSGKQGESLTSRDRGIAEASMGGSQQELRFQGRLDALSISTHGGFVVLGEARYPISWDESIKEKLKSILDKDAAVFVARPLYDFSRLSEAPVRFIVSDCFPGQLEL